MGVILDVYLFEGVGILAIIALYYLALEFLGTLIARNEFETFLIKSCDLDSITLVEYLKFSILYPFAIPASIYCGLTYSFDHLFLLI